MKELARVELAQLPTAVEALLRLSEALDGPRLLVKRDDQTGLALGGNKTRKLEYLLFEAQEAGADMLITAGAVQSNHCRQTAAAAARCGLACTLVLAGDPPAASSGNLLLDRLLGAEVVWAQHETRDQVLLETFQTAQRNGRRPYLIPYGGSSPTGAAAYTLAMRELLEQLVEIGIQQPNWIVFASSSGGTQAGLVLGARLFEFSGRVLGISIAETAAVLKPRVASLACSTAEFLGETLDFSPEDILVNDDYLGGGYGVIGEQELNAVRLLARTEGLLVDPVYTGRAAAGLLDLIRRRTFSKNETVLFWHTGGAPALFADRYQEALTA